MHLIFLSKKLYQEKKMIAIGLAINEFKLIIQVDSLALVIQATCYLIALMLFLPHMYFNVCGRLDAHRIISRLCKALFDLAPMWCPRPAEWVGGAV